MSDTQHAYVAATVALNTYFCNGYSGRKKTDPVYQYVVEKRDVPATYTRYSSCGDRAAAVLFRLGCREPWVNRNENKGWHIGANISALAFKAPSHTPKQSWIPSTGDELLIWNGKTGGDAHSLAIVEYNAEKGTAVFANYGSAGMSAAEFPGAKFSDAPLVYESQTKMWRCGRRLVQRVLTLPDIIPFLTVPPNLTYLDGDVLPDMSKEQDEIMAMRPELWTKP